MKIPMIFLMAICSYNSFADICPPPGTSIQPSISASVAYDKKTKTYKYSYTVENGRSATVPIEYLALNLFQRPSGAVSPAHWTSTYDEANLPYSPANLTWRAQPQPSDIDKIPDDAPSTAITRLSSAIKAGKSLSSFSFESEQPPAMVQYYADGFTQVPRSSPSNTSDEPVPNCPGWSFDVARYKSIVTGMTVGPADPNVQSVALRLRSERGDHHCGDIDPEHAKGKVSVLVLSSKTFDASSIDPSTVTFGPADVVPLSSKLVEAGGENRANWDEHEAWEKERAKIEKEDMRPAKQRPQNLLLTFDLASLDVRCGLDKALFLNGKTKTGKSIMGGVTPRLAGCLAAGPGIRHHAGKRNSPY